MRRASGVTSRPALLERNPIPVVLPVTPRRSGAVTGPKLLAIATDHVRKHGVERTTIVSVAQEAGISHAAVYRYYSSKDDLIDAITQEWLKSVENTLTGIADAPDPAQDKFERLILALARAMRDRLDSEPKLYELWLLAIKGGRIIVRKHRRRLRQILERVLDEAVSTETFHGKSHERMLIFVFDVMHRFIDPVAIGIDKDIPRAQIDQRLELALRMTLRALMSGAV